MLVPQLNYLGGMNSSVSPFLQPQDSPSVLNGVQIGYKLGALTKDPGYSQVGDTLQSGKDITGLYDFRQSPSVQKTLATVNNSGDTALTLKYNNAGTWTDITLSSAWNGYEDALVEMETFIGYCFFVGYDVIDDVFLPVGSLTGTTFSTSTNVTSMPQGKYIVRYRDRLYVINTYYSGTAYPYRVYFSSVPSAGAITWTPASDFLDVDYGEELTGAADNWDRLVLFTQNSAYFYDQSSFKKVWATGCAAHRTIKNHGPYMLWCDYDGVWMSTGGQPQNISGPVVDFIRNGDPTTFFSCIVDEEYRMYVGTVIVNSVTYANCELRFHIPTSTWTIREYYDNFTVYAESLEGGKQRQLMGADDGEVMKKGKYTDNTLVSADDGRPITVTFILPPMFLGDLASNKGMKRLVAFANRAQGLKLKYRLLDNNTQTLTPFMKLGELTKYINTFDVSADKNSVMLQVAGSENSTNPYFEFYGLAADVIPKSRTYASNNK